MWHRQRRARRESHIRDFILPHGLFDKLRERHPHLSLNLPQGVRPLPASHASGGAGRGQQGNAGIRRTWHYACHEENINPRKPSRLPLLFALDGKLNIPNGFTYVPDCSGFQRKHGNGDGGVPYCGADLGSAGSGCGGGSDLSGCGGD